MTEREIELPVDAFGKAVDARCPAHETPVILSRGGKPESKTPRITWLTTGDGIIRTINFDVP